MSKRTTEEEAIKRVKSVLPENIKFLGWKEGKWLGTKKNSAILYCETHKITFNILYRYLITLDKNSVKCPNCVDRSKAGEFITMRNKENILPFEEVKVKIDEFFKRNPHIELASEIKYVGLTNTKIDIRCKKHNKIIKDVSLFNITRDLYIKGERKFHCPECEREEHSARMRNSPEKAYNMVMEKFKNINTGYNYEKIKTTYTGRTNKVTITCPKHGDFEVTFSNLVSGRERKTFNGMCPGCYRDLYCVSEETARKKIEEAINYRNNTLGYNLSFLGFLGGKWSGTSTKLIIKCNVHNSISNTLSYSEFITDKKTFIGCKQCCTSHKTSNSEKLCKLEIEKYINSDKIETQHLFRIYDNICNINRKIFVDFYIEERNLVIEYDGEQHFNYLPLFQSSYRLYVNQVNRDKCLNRFCKENSINLLRISYKDNNRLEEVIRAYFEEGKDITTKVDPILLPIKYEGN